MNRKKTATVVLVCAAGIFLPGDGAVAVVRPAIARSPVEVAKPAEVIQPANADSIGIELRSRVETDSARVMLDQIATCVPARTSGFDCAEVLAVDVGAAPAPGKTLRFSRSALADMLAKEFPGAAVEILGPESSFVTARGVPLADEMLANPFRQQLEEIFVANQEFRVQVTGLRIEQRPQVRPGDVTCRFAQIDLLRQRSHDPAGYSIESDIESLVTRIHNGAQFNAQCFHDNGAGKDESNLSEAATELPDPPFYVQFMPRILVERRMPVARHDLPAKAVFRAEDAVDAWVPWNRGAGRAVRDVASLTGMALVRPVQAGQMLLMRDFERPVVLRRGDTVQLQQRAGDLVISGNAVVVTQGAVGDRIEVQSVATRKRLRAVVKSNSVVEAM
jgi:flagella basal body P-ring formation protein FlgA